MLTVAERVETQADADWLRTAGIDCLQGYLVGRPSPVAELPQAESPDERRAG
jgi:EAL domain-containing protein (putative c-di-GMP-specific phosphodiesterase class I)